MQRTPFYSFHSRHEAKFVDFAGWQMPIMYRSIHQEHRHVRTAGGVFDVSHMGRIKISGRHARRFLETILTRRVSDMPPQLCRYSLICNEQGGVLDDVIVYRFDGHWMLVVNAANQGKILDHLRANAADLVVTIDDLTETTAMIAVQGPNVMAMIGQFSSEVPSLKRYTFCEKNLLVMKMTISRTGYTGEDGVEVIINAKAADMAVKLLLRDGTDQDAALWPVGLGARDTLRLEAAMPLYGHELDEQTDPLAANLDFAVSLDKDQYDNGEAFIGQDALRRIAREGPPKKLIGLKLDGKRTARQHMDVCHRDDQVGSITSGCISPTLDYPIALAYVKSPSFDVGHMLNVQLGTQRVDAQVVSLPFYKRKA